MNSFMKIYDSGVLKERFQTYQILKVSQSISKPVTIQFKKRLKEMFHLFRKTFQIKMSHLKMSQVKYIIHLSLTSI
jgi:hypothetical protein